VSIEYDITFGGPDDLGSAYYRSTDPETGKVGIVFFGGTAGEEQILAPINDDIEIELFGEVALVTFEGRTMRFHLIQEQWIP
jgi:hypothetical protein